MITHKGKRILVAMSGGVDSSAAVVMLKEQGWECVGVMMDLHGDTDTEDARRVAEHLGIEFHVTDFRKEFKRIIIDKFVEDYKRGLTPNPCVDCNREIKFGLLWEKARELGCSAMATGHYARIAYECGHPVLKKAVYEAKDQSYFLHVIPKELLSKIVFPLGEISSKDETRAIARKAGLDIASKGDSQDICFVPDGDYVRVIRNQYEMAITDDRNEKQADKQSEECSRHNCGLKEGDFVSEDGKTLGRHKGIICYTIGQRKGLGIASSNGPLYVLDKDPSANTVVLGSNDALFKREVEATGVNWLVCDEVPAEFRCSARIRYRHKEQPCTVYVEKSNVSESISDDDHAKKSNSLTIQNVKILFDEPQRAITPGQAVVFYSGGRVLGGGTIIK